MEKLKGTSKDLLAENINELRKLFPEAFTEDKIDFETLKEVLGEYVEKDKERYSFNWAGKQQARREAQKVSTGTLRPCKEESVNFDDTENLYIEGDNLEVLKLLQKSYHNSIKMIYIDPPYNTGKDFVYKDNYHDNLKNYKQVTGQVDSEGNKLSTNSDSAGRYHSNWLNMMYPRLKLARNLLKDDGVIFISIDDIEVGNLRKICDEIFGEENLLSELIWHLSSGTQAGHFTRANEAILCYSKNKKVLSFFEDKSGGTIKHGALKKISLVNPRSRVLFKKGSITYEGHNAVFNGELGGSERQFIISEKMLFKDGLLDQDVEVEAGWAMKNQLLSWLDGKETYDTKGQKVIRFYFNSQGILFYEKERGTVHPKTVLPSFVGNTKSGSNEIKKLFDSKIMDYPKPSSLIKYLSKVVTNNDDIILDFFSGSATTAHAVLDLNKEDGGNRKFIMVQLPEPTAEKSEAFKAGYKTIAEIGKERIRRVIHKMHNSECIINNQNTEEGNSQLSINNPSKPDLRSELDLGFKVFKLDSSNIKAWDSQPEDLTTQLKAFVNNIKEDRTEDDILYEILLKYGLELTVPIENSECIIENGKRKVNIYNIAMGEIIACLDDSITLQVVEHIAKMKDEFNPESCRVVFMDNGFKNDVVKTNAMQILAKHGIEEIRSI